MKNKDLKNKTKNRTQKKIKSKKFKDIVSIIEKPSKIEKKNRQNQKYYQNRLHLKSHYLPKSKKSQMEKIAKF